MEILKVLLGYWMILFLTILTGLAKSTLVISDTAWILTSLVLTTYIVLAVYLILR